MKFDKHYFKELVSSNSFLINKLESSYLPEAYTVIPSFQSRGKGQGVANWESENKKNLLLSTFLRPTNLKAEDQFVVSIMFSLAIVDVLASFLPTNRISIKWPNDIYFDSQKIAGVLIQNSIKSDYFEWSVIGIGLNVNQLKFVSDAPNPVSLKMILGNDISIPHLTDMLEQKLKDRYTQLQQGDYDNLRDDYLNKLYQRNIWKNYRSEGQVFQGKILGIDQYGFLQMQVQQGIRSFDVKEVEYLK